MDDDKLLKTDDTLNSLAIFTVHHTTDTCLTDTARRDNCAVINTTQRRFINCRRPAIICIPSYLIPRHFVPQSSSWHGLAGPGRHRTPTAGRGDAAVTTDHWTQMADRSARHEAARVRRRPPIHARRRQSIIARRRWRSELRPPVKRWLTDWLDHNNITSYRAVTTVTASVSDRSYESELCATQRPERQQ